MRIRLWQRGLSPARDAIARCAHPRWKGGGPLAIRAVVGLTILAALGVSGCNRERSAWERASRDATVSSYEAYLSSYPNGEHAPVAAAMLQEAKAWDTALATDTLAAIRAFLSTYPDGRYQEAAHDRLASLLQKAEGDAFSEAARVDTHLSYSSFLKEFPEGANAAAAQQLARERLLSGFRPDVVLFIGHPRLRAGLAVVRGSIVFSPAKGPESIILHPGGMVLRDTVALAPDPAAQRVAVVVDDVTDLPPGLERGKVYVWHGADEFTFWRVFTPFPDDSRQRSRAQQQLAAELGVRLNAQLDVVPVPFFRGERPSMIEFVR